MRSFLALTFILCSCLETRAADKAEQKSADPLKVEFFEKKVRPLLAERCLDCHNEDNQESKLRLDTLSGMLEGGLRGPAIIPGKAEESLLIRALRHGELLKMPPKEKLKTAQIAVFAKWIAEGAVWPNAVATTSDTSQPRSGPVEFTAEEKGFWAFQRPVPHDVPTSRRVDWVQNPIDAFILRRLEQAGLQPAPRASRRALIRRITFALTGLPPTPAEVDAFSNDESPAAWSKLVERLLASPHYGERWGRHWLDVARYADSNGLDENLAHANAFRYRDYVIRAFNQDKPFNRFAQEQIAGDRLDHDSLESELDGITATAFLVIGPKMLAEDDPVKLKMDVIDEQIDTMGRAFLGMTLGCARCHDHKFDPIPTTDYYALAGIFHSTKVMNSYNVVAQWHERELAAPEVIAERQRFMERIAAIDKDVASVSETATEKITDEAIQHLGDYLLAAERKRRLDSLSGRPIGKLAASDRPQGTRVIEAEDFQRGNVNKDFSTYGKGIGVLVNKGPTPNFAEYDIEVPAAGLYQIELRYAAAASRPCLLIINGETVKKNVADGVTGTWQPDTQTWEVEGFYEFRKGRNLVRLEHPQFFPHIDKVLLSPAPDSIRVDYEPLDRTYKPVTEFVTQWVEALATVKADDDVGPLSRWKQSAQKAKSLADVRDLAAYYQTVVSRNASIDTSTPLVDPQMLKQLLGSDKSPFRRPAGIEKSFPKEAAAKLTALRGEQKKLKDSTPPLPSTMAVNEGDIADIRIHVRGSHLTQGASVPRRFLQIVSGTDQTPVAKDSSGRRELAEWLASDDNPLTARVFVNRIWHWHFGNGLVSSPDNFGRLGERPSHPELLDWLAVRFVESGWSVKQLHRLILLSSTWQQSTVSPDQAVGYAADPENRLLWKMNRRRLEAEEVRDSILQIAGRLDRSMGGSMLPTKNRAYVTSTANVSPKIYSSDRRSLYLPIVRSAVYEVLTAFDFADPSVISGTRQSTTVASQALFMMNSGFMTDQTQTLAERLLSDDGLDDRSRLQDLYQSVLSRSPTDDEAWQTLKFISEYESRWKGARPDAASEGRRRAWQAVCRILIAANEFMFVE